MGGIIGGDRVRRAEARREHELDERLQQEDTRIGAEAANAEASARPPSTPRSRAVSGVVGDRPIRQSETRGVDERQSSPTRRPADATQDQHSRKAARSTPQFDDSWSPGSKRYRGLPTGTTQADYQAWMRANRYPTSYGPDNPPTEDDGERISSYCRPSVEELTSWKYIRRQG